MAERGGGRKGSSASEEEGRDEEGGGSWLSRRRRRAGERQWSREGSEVSVKGQEKRAHHEGSRREERQTGPEVEAR